jgi:hypothetical protein
MRPWSGARLSEHRGFMPEDAQQTHKHTREVLRVDDLSDAELAAIAAAEAPAWVQRFNGELASPAAAPDERQ